MILPGNLLNTAKFPLPRKINTFPFMYLRREGREKREGGKREGGKVGKEREVGTKQREGERNEEWSGQDCRRREKMGGRREREVHVRRRMVGERRTFK